MSLIHCSCDCLYQKDGFCDLEKASEITNLTKKDGCFYYVPQKAKPKRDRNVSVK